MLRAGKRGCRNGKRVGWVWFCHCWFVSAGSQTSPSTPQHEIFNVLKISSASNRCDCFRLGLGTGPSASVGWGLGWGSGSAEMLSPEDGRDARCPRARRGSARLLAAALLRGGGSGRAVPSATAPSQRDAAELCNQPVPSGENSSCSYLQNSTCRDNKHRGDSPTPGLFA